MNRCVASRVVAGLLLGGFCNGMALAEDWLVLDRPELELLARYSGRWYETATWSNLDSIFESGLGLTQSGYSLDPGIFKFDIRLEPLYRRISRE